jgi:penicillin-binding protein 2
MFMYQPGLLPEYMRRVGFGSPTGLRDLDDSAGFITTPDWKLKTMGYDWNFSDEVNISIGQGEVQVTPLQVVRWYAAIANRGELLRPQLVKQVGILGEAPSYTLAPDVMGEVGVKPEIYDMLREGLCAVTQSRAGTAEYQFRNYPDLQNIGVCGKTGTAQDGSSPDAVSHAWFASFAPMDNPQVALAVLVENSGEGSGVAAPLSRDIWRYYFFGEMPAS